MNRMRPVVEGSEWFYMRYIYATDALPSRTGVWACTTLQERLVLEAGQSLWLEHTLHQMLADLLVQ